MPLLHTALMYSRERGGRTLNNKIKSKATNSKHSQKAEKKYYCTLHKNMSHFIKLYRFVRCLIVAITHNICILFNKVTIVDLAHSCIDHAWKSIPISSETIVIYLF